MSKHEYDLDDMNLSQSQLDKLELLRNWVLTEAEFYGRSDNAVLILFLNSCDYDEEYTKVTMTNYYKARRDYPEWWGNRSWNPALFRILDQRVATAFINTRIDQPTVALLQFGRLRDLTVEIDDLFKAGSYALQVGCLMRWKNVVRNDVILIFDCKNYDWKFILKVASPTLFKKILVNFYVTSPFKFKKFIALNIPYIIKAMVPLLLSFLPSEVRNKVVLYGSKWPSLTDHVPCEILPAEYGGEGPPLKYQEDVFELELRQYDDYMEDDVNYGYK